MRQTDRQTDRQGRNSWLELLRIISMALITVNHFSGGEAWNYKGAGLGSVAVYQIYRPLGQVGVDIFVLITGYFMADKIDSDYTKSLKRAGKVWLESWFYSIVLFAFASLLLGKFSLSGLVKALLPVTFNAYWFVTAYVILVLLIPFINRVLVKLSKSDFLLLLIVFVFFAEVTPILGNNIFSLDKGFGDLLAVYLLGAYFKRFPVNFKAVYTWISVFVCYALMLISIVALEKLGGPRSNFTRFAYGIFPYIMAGGIFLIFVNKPTFTNKTINYLAGSVFATYLITANEYISSEIWTKWFDVTGVSSPILIVLLGLLITAFLVVVTIFIDKLRIWLFKILHVEQGLGKLIDWLNEKCISAFTKIG
jgi:surface polysaccharide O-acyltransferase-like enzyme